MSDYASLDALRAQMRQIMGLPSPEAGGPQTMSEGMQGRSDLADLMGKAKPDPTYDKTKK